MCGFVVGKPALGQVFSEHFGSPANPSTNFSIIIITRDWHNTHISGRSAEWTQLDSTHHYTNYAHDPLHISSSQTLHIK
jgi:hypothetical protein